MLAPVEIQSKYLCGSNKWGLFRKVLPGGRGFDREKGVWELASKDQIDHRPSAFTAVEMADISD